MFVKDEAEDRKLDLFELKTKGAMIKSRAKWVEWGEEHKVFSESWKI